MKSNIFRKVLKEEYIEVNKSISKTIEHLCVLSSSSNKDLPADTYIHCLCSKKGSITVRYTYRQAHIPHLYMRHKTFENMYPLYCVYGKVLCKDGKTYIKMSSIYKRSNLFLRCFLKVLGVAFIPLYLLSSIPFNRFNLPLFLIAAVISIIVFLNVEAPSAVQKSRGLIMLPYMENEIKIRVKNIEKWED